MKTKAGQAAKRTQRDYNLGFKLAVVSEIEKGDLSYKQAQAKYGIQGRSTVLVWLRKHGRMDWASSSQHTKPMPKSPQTPAQKIKQLERQLADEKARVLVYDEMLRIIDSEQGSQLRKKLSAEVSARCNGKGKLA